MIVSCSFRGRIYRTTCRGSASVDASESWLSSSWKTAPKKENLWLLSLRKRTFRCPSACTDHKPSSNIQCAFLQTARPFWMSSFSFAAHDQNVRRIHNRSAVGCEAAQPRQRARESAFSNSEPCHRANENQPLLGDSKHQNQPLLNE